MSVLLMYQNMQMSVTLTRAVIVIVHLIENKVFGMVIFFLYMPIEKQSVALLSKYEPMKKSAAAM